MVPARGFTIVELLLTIAIIGILTAGAIAAINIPFQLQKARDGQRKAELKTIQSALEFIRSDTGSYPLLVQACGSGAWVVGGLTYMNKVPCDPKGGNYTYSGSTLSYTLSACLENINDPEGGVACGSGGKLYTVINP